MGVHHAHPTSPASRIVGRGALTAAAALALAGGAGSVAFADELPAPAHDATPQVGHAAAGEGSWKGTMDQVIDVKHKVNDLSGTPDPALIGLASGMGQKDTMDEVIDLKHKVNDVNSALDPMLLSVAHDADASPLGSAGPSTAAASTHHHTGTQHASFLSFAGA